MTFSYDFPRPAVTVDAVVLRTASGFFEILLIKRKRAPFSGFWALPGGFMEMDETPQAAATRELFEETGVKNLDLTPVFACAQPGRDPRGRCVTLVYGTLISGAGLEPCGGDDASEAAWFPFISLPAMAFDHDGVLKQVKMHLRWQASTSVIGRNCLEKEFDKSSFLKLHHNFAGIPESDNPLERGLRLSVLQQLAENAYRFVKSGEIGLDWVPGVW